MATKQTKQMQLENGTEISTEEEIFDEISDSNISRLGSIHAHPKQKSFGDLPNKKQT